jgi:hypothetical protein
MRINHQVVVFDAADLTTESRFWAGLLGGTIDAEDRFHMVFVDGAPRVGVQLAPNHVAPRMASRNAAADPSRPLGRRHRNRSRRGHRTRRKAAAGGGRRRARRRLPSLCRSRGPSVLPLLGEAQVVVMVVVLGVDAAQQPCPWAYRTAQSSHSKQYAGCALWRTRRASAFRQAELAAEIRAVVVAYVLAVLLIALQPLLVVGGLADLILGQVDVDLAVVGVDSVNDTSR